MGSRSRLYVGKLSSRTRERDLEDLFSKYGRVATCDVKFGFAFVEFEDSRDAEDAMRALDGEYVDGQRIIVEFSKGPRDRERRVESGGRVHHRGEFRLVVEGLPRDMSWQDLKDLARKVGDVQYTDVHYDRGGRNKGYGGIIEYRNADDMRAAIRELDGSEVRGYTITVREDRGRSRSRSRSRSPPRRRSRSPRRRSPSPRRPSPRRSPSPHRRSGSPARRSPSPRRSPPPGSPAGNGDAN